MHTNESDISLSEIKLKFIELTLAIKATESGLWGELDLWEKGNPWVPPFPPKVSEYWDRFNNARYVKMLTFSWHGL
jgi:hypothetical protein